MDNYINIVDIIKYLDSLTGRTWYMSNDRSRLASLSNKMNDRVYELLKSNNISYEVGYLAVYVEIPDVIISIRDNKINQILD